MRTLWIKTILSKKKKKGMPKFIPYEPIKTSSIWKRPTGRDIAANRRLSLLKWHMIQTVQFSIKAAQSQKIL